MAEFDQLIRQANKAAKEMGGLIAILLAIKKGKRVKWDEDTARFVVDGNTIPITQIRRELERVNSRIAIKIIDYNEKLWSKQWTLKKWREEMDRLIEESHVLFGAMAVGSIIVATETEVTIRRIDRDVEAVLRYSKAIRSGFIPSLPAANNRSRAYLRAWNVTYHLLSHRAHVLAGFKEARRILSPSEHCRTKGDKAGCLETAERGWIPIRNMPLIGTLICMQFCKCWISYRR